MAKRANELFNELTAMDATRLARELEDSYRQLFTLRLGRDAPAAERERDR